MKNFKLNHRLVGGFGLLLIGMAVLGGIALAGLRQIQALGRELTEHSLSGLYHATGLRATMLTSLSVAARAGQRRGQGPASRSSRARSAPQTKSGPRSARTTSRPSSPTKIDGCSAPPPRRATPSSRCVTARMALMRDGKSAEARVLVKDSGRAFLPDLPRGDQRAGRLQQAHRRPGRQADRRVDLEHLELDLDLVHRADAAGRDHGGVHRPLGGVLGAGPARSRRPRRSGRPRRALRLRRPGRGRTGRPRARSDDRRAQVGPYRRQAPRRARGEEQRRSAAQGRRDPGDGAGRRPGRPHAAGLGLGRRRRRTARRGLRSPDRRSHRNMAAISRNAQALASSSDELTSSSQKMAASSEETSAQAGSVSAAAEQVSKSVQTVAGERRGDDRVDQGDRASNAHEAAKVATSAVRVADDDQRDHRQAGRELDGDRQGGQGHHLDRRADQSAGAERDDRGGARRRGRARASPSSPTRSRSWPRRPPRRPRTSAARSTRSRATPPRP